VDKGKFFGERAIHDNKKRGATIMPITDVELLAITREMFNYIKSNFDKKKNKILSFMAKYFPKIEALNSKKVFENLFYLLEEQEYDYNSMITKEDTYGDKFYILFEGELELNKSIVINDEHTFKYPISEMAKNVRGGKSIKEHINVLRI